ncbi:MAG: hypothetical protein CO032_04330 [Nitrosopumilales archaeon CG_4_9_14_0_2_um_filter_34_16]|nr:MAG: hypothetical protein CO032_04330 [Nitrosopumilales archaeon CG_4_9_14_0_2_um_filter_34_16]
MKTRTSIVDALHIVLEVLKSGEPFTLNKLAKESDLNFRTVKKIIDVLQSSHISFSGKQLEVSDLESTTIIQLKEKTGLLLFPESIQNLIIKTNHYPVASRDEEILVHLLLKKATTPENAVYLPEGRMIEELVGAEHVGKIGNRFYLTEDGRYIAKGALELYPELESISIEKPKENTINVGRLTMIALGAPPNTVMVKRKLEELRCVQ